MKITLEGSGDSAITIWLVNALQSFASATDEERITKVKSIEYPAGVTNHVLVKWFKEPDEDGARDMDEAIGQHAPSETRGGNPFNLCYDGVSHEWPRGRRSSSV